MSPFIQQLVLVGSARLYEQGVFTAAGQNSASTLAPNANYVYVLYELDLSPHDINLVVALTGPNVVGGATIRSLGYPVESAYLATPDAPIDLTVQNGTDSATYVTLRYAELTSLKFRQIVDPSYQGEAAGWAAQLNRVNQMPSGVSTQRKG
jgi:hypothetical protein